MLNGAGSVRAAGRRLSNLPSRNSNVDLDDIGTLNTLEFGARAIALRPFFLWGSPMFDPATTALLRAVLDEVCEDVSRYETGARTHVASRILEAATNGDTSPERLKEVGREALHAAPTMWR